MVTDSQISPWLQPGFAQNEALQKEVEALARQYPYFLPLKALSGLHQHPEKAFQELPYYYGINRVLLATMEQKMRQSVAPAPATPVEEPRQEEIVAETAAIPAAIPEESNPVVAPLPETVAESPTPEVPAPVSPEEPMAALTAPEPVQEPELVQEPESVPGTEPMLPEEETVLPEETEVIPEPENNTASSTSPAMPLPHERRAAEPVYPVPNPDEKTAEKTSGAAPPVSPRAKEPVIQPLYTKDYFSHQGLSNAEEELNIFKAQRPSGNDLMVMRSFGEWLRFFQAKKVQDEEEVADKKALKAMWQKGKLAAALEEEDEEIPEVVFEMAVKSISQEANPATETMAKIYLAQGKWEKAVDVYQQLQLRSPQKSAYFAEKIAAIEQQHRP